jgi:Ca-activated chloride channel homolog
MLSAVHACRALLLLVWRRRAGVLCCLASLSLVTSDGFGQQKDSRNIVRERLAVPVESPVEDILRIDTDVVAVDVRVTDREGRPIRNLRPEDFKLYEDGLERPISFFQVERKNGNQQPVAVVFALDTSGSMSTEEMKRLRAAMSVFSSWLAERPSVFAVVSFGMSVRVLQSFTSDFGKMDQAFERLIKESRGLSTHTYDAVDDAIRMLRRKAPRTRDQKMMKRVVVVVTDGFPVGDTVSPKTVIERANAAEVSVYSITLPSFSPALAHATRLTPLPTPLDVSGLVERTGGMGVYATERELEPLLEALAAEITSSYVLAFYPTEEKRRDRRFHTIRIETPPGLVVRQSRPGFLGNMH